MKQKEYFGAGSIRNLGSIISENKAKDIFLVTGKKSYESCGAKEKIEPILKGCNITYFSDFEANPKIYDIIKGIEIFRKGSYDLVVGVGGGSVIDTAKLINILSAQRGEPVEYLKKGGKIENESIPLVAIPTTSGSGSEATHFAVVYIEGVKNSLAHEYIIPNYCIIDPDLTMNLPQNITASSGMDALSQAIESYWCINSNEESKRYARESITLAIDNLKEAVNSPSKESRSAMAKAAYLSGKAINITKTTACHAVSYPITSHFNIPHGHAVGLTLAEMMEFNLNVTEDDCLDKRGADYVKDTIYDVLGLMGAENIDEGKNILKNLMKNIGLETSLSKIGILNTEIILEEGFNPERVKNNPRELSRDNLKFILKNIY